MAWIKVDDQMVDHPKIVPLTDAAFRWVHYGLSYANRFLTNGRLPPRFIDAVPVGVLAELTTPAAGERHPVWDRYPDGTIRIHDFREYQLSRKDVERAQRLNKARQAKWRESNAVTPPSRNGVTPPSPQRPRNSAPTQPNPTRSTPPLKPPRRRKPRLSEAQHEDLNRRAAAIDAQIAELVDRAEKGPRKP